MLFLCSKLCKLNTDRNNVVSLHLHLLYAWNLRPISFPGGCTRSSTHDVRVRGSQSTSAYTAPNGKCRLAGLTLTQWLWHNALLHCTEMPIQTCYTGMTPGVTSVLAAAALKLACISPTTFRSRQF